MDILSDEKAKNTWMAYELEGKSAQEQARKEATPTSDSVWNYFYANEESGDWRNF